MNSSVEFCIKDGVAHNKGTIKGIKIQSPLMTPRKEPVNRLINPNPEMVMIKEMHLLMIQDPIKIRTAIKNMLMIMLWELESE